MRRTTLDTLLAALAGVRIALIRRHQITHDTTTAPKVEQITTA